MPEQREGEALRKEADDLLRKGESFWAALTYKQEADSLADALAASQERERQLAEAKRVEEYVERVRAIARECGYAVGVHGTLKRDLDLIAAPWTIEAVSAQGLVGAICEGMGLRPKYVNDYPDGRVMSNPEAKPWGRIGWSLIGPLPKPCKYVDLSVAPRTGESFPIQFAALDSQTHGGSDEPLT